MVLGPRTTVYNRYAQWGERGVWWDIFEALAQQQSNALAVIPSKSNEHHPIPHDASLYARRNIVERFFCTMKDMRSLAIRFEKLKRNFLSMIHIFAILCWIY